MANFHAGSGKAPKSSQGVRSFGEKIFLFNF
jgi:hypothetical protein